MLCVLPFHFGDVSRVRTLLGWIRQLGGCSRHKMMLCVDQATPWTQVFQLRALAETMFAKVDLACNSKSVGGWPQGPNSLWLVAAQEIESHEMGPWFWLEPDALPLEPGWLDTLELEYQTCGKSFVGAITEGLHTQTGEPVRQFAGVGMYPERAHSIMGDCVRANPNAPFDFSTAAIVLPLAYDTPLIHHIWGEQGNPPTFKEQNVPATNVFSPRQIRKGAVVFHRCKDNSLMELKRRELFPHTMVELTVVIPFCARDGELFCKNLQWWGELNGAYPFRALLSYQRGTPAGMVDAMTKLTRCFRSVATMSYEEPTQGHWPPSVAFRAAAYGVQQFKTPWLWTEFDMIPLKPEWLDVLALEYGVAGRSFMGPIVPHLGHMNGTGIYPPDTPAKIPKALAQFHTAWDVAMKPEMEKDCHDCSHIFQHVWGVHNGKFHPYLGEPPSFPLQAMTRQIDPKAVVFHRCKDGSLIDRLRETKPRP